ncbi:MAG: hypothetical protein M3443_00255 [Actinomycetota bacterium]|nr:hypothetical protein [Actinomycetota bacterium]
MGAPHTRDRLFLLAWDQHTTPVADPARDRRPQRQPQLPRPTRQPHTALHRLLATAHTPHRRSPHQQRLGDTSTTMRRPVQPEPRTSPRARSRSTSPRVPHLARSARDVDYAGYEPAIRRWEQHLGRLAPDPTTTGRRGQVLNPAFVEWMMGLPAGWVTDLPIPRTAQIKALGNGVVPAQAAHAVSHLLADLAALLDTDDHPNRGRGVRAA